METSTAITFFISSLGLAMIAWAVYVYIYNIRKNYRIVRDNETGYYMIQKEIDHLWSDFNVTENPSTSAPQYHTFAQAETDLKRFLGTKQGEKFSVEATAYADRNGIMFKKYN